MGGHKVEAIAYADDIVLFASSRMGLSHVLQQFTERARAIGLTLGVRKCITAGKKWLGNAKIVIDNEPFRVGPQKKEIPMLSSVGTIYTSI